MVWQRGVGGGMGVTAPVVLEGVGSENKAVHWRPCHGGQRRQNPSGGYGSTCERGNHRMRATILPWVHGGARGG